MRMERDADPQGCATGDCAVVDASQLFGWQASDAKKKRHTRGVCLLAKGGINRPVLQRLCLVLSTNV